MDQKFLTRLNRRRLDRIGFSSILIAALIAVFGFFSAAQSDDFDDFIEALNRLIAQEGPVPGQIADPLPEDQLAEEMAAAGQDLSNGRSNTPEPENPAQFAFETDQQNESESVTAGDFDRGVLQENGKIDVPTGAGPSSLYGAEPFTQKVLRLEEFGNASILEEPHSAAEGAFLPTTGQCPELSRRRRDRRLYGTARYRRPCESLPPAYEAFE